MALYVSVATRRRRTIVIAVVVALVAFGLGWAYGRQQVPSVADRASDVAADGSRIATGIERLDIEYEQVLTGAGDTVQAGVLEPLEDLRTDLQGAFERAPWVTSAERGVVLDALSAVESSARASEPLDQFRSLLDQAGGLVRSALGST